MQNNQKIPKGWSVKKLGEISCLIAGNAFNSEDFIDMGIPLIRISNIADDGIVLDENTAFLPESFLKENSKFVIRQTDLLIAMSGATTGKMGINTFSEPMLLNQRVCIIRAKDVLQNFLNQYLFTHKKDILRQSYGGAQPNIGNNDIKKIKVLLPPLEEQEKIAGILGTWDEAIEKLSSLIEQKKRLKKGLMQKLLTGQTRLPGFTQPWKEVKLGEIGTISSAGVDKKIVEGEDLVELLNYMDVYKKDFLYKTDTSMTVSAPMRQIKNCNLRKGDIFFTPSSETPDDIAHSAVVMEDIPNGVYSYHIIRLRPTTLIDLKFSAYAFKTAKFYKQAYAWCEGSGQRYVISQDDFRNMKIYIPSNISEQHAIADVLSTSDDEINLLNQKLEALKEQKKGLMQQLLTGQIRVKVN